MLNKSQLYTFIDHDKKFALYFLEGQKLIHDLVLTHHLNHGGFSYFRSTVLSVQLMLGLLKHGEYFCFYIDSETPYFRLKIEMNTQGLMRGMMYSDELKDTPDTISGKIRIVKFQPNAEMPYQSTIDLNQVSIDEIMNQVLSRSYQIKSQIFVSGRSDQSIMLHQLPLTVREEPSDLEVAFERYIEPLKEIMSKGLTEKASICQEFESVGFNFLASQTVEFKCGCSKQQMIDNIIKFLKSSNEDLFSPDRPFIEVTCEYCKHSYRITKNEVQKSSPDYH